MRKTKRKANTALVYNPARGLSLGSRTTRRASARKANPVKRTAAVANPRKRRTTRRRRNPSTFSLLTNPSGGALMGAVFAGAGFSLVNLTLQRLIPSGSPVVQIAAKLATGFVVQTWGSKVPILGKHKDGIAFLCFALAAYEGVNYWLLPTIRQQIGQLTGGLNAALMPAPAAQAETLAGIYGNRYQPAYY